MTRSKHLTRSDVLELAAALGLRGRNSPIWPLTVPELFSACVVRAKELHASSGGAPHARHGVAYPVPLPASGEDPRFSIGLLFDVAEALSRRGYPTLADGADVRDLQDALFDFVYGDNREHQGQSRWRRG